MSGRKIHDMGGYPHTSDMSMKSSNKVKHYQSAVGAGHEGGMYPDTTEDIHRDQEHGASKLKSKPMKAGYRN
jgi:hypothetical protein